MRGFRLSKGQSVKFQSLPPWEDPTYLDTRRRERVAVEADIASRGLGEDDSWDEFVKRWRFSPLRDAEERMFMDWLILDAASRGFLVTTGYGSEVINAVTGEPAAVGEDSYFIHDDHFLDLVLTMQSQLDKDEQVSWTVSSWFAELEKERVESSPEYREQVAFENELMFGHRDYDPQFHGVV